MPCGYISILLALVLVFLSTSSIAVPSIQHWQLANGVKVYFVPTEGLPILDAQVVLHAGSAQDGDKLGQAALTSALLDQGADGLTAQKIAEALENVGAQLGTSTSRDFTTLSFRSLTDDVVLKKSWAVFSTVLNKPNFPKVDFKRVKERTLLSIKRRQESPGTLAQLALYAQIYQGHPYANPIQGTKASVKNIFRTDLQHFYKQHYVGKNMLLVLVGGVSRSKAEVLAKQLVGDLKPGVRAAPIPVVKDVGKGVVIHKEYPSQQTHLFYAAPVLTHNDPDYFALYVGNHILGGSGFSSRIVKEIREKRGLAYSAYSYFNPMMQKGPFLLGLQTKNEKVREASKALKETLQNFIEKGPTAEEVVASKKNINGGFALKLDSNKKLLGQVVGIVASSAPLDYLNSYLSNIAAVTRAQIKDAFQRRVIMDKMVMVTVGQAAKGD
ncbi:MAG: peptidase M16 [Piscirickettsiaceae bacterium]|nr:MAG: peptidase M16 [Piscirickettsiaceae bacterium]